MFTCSQRVSSDVFELRLYEVLIHSWCVLPTVDVGRYVPTRKLSNELMWSVVARAAAKRISATKTKAHLKNISLIGPYI